MSDHPKPHAESPHFDQDLYTDAVQQALTGYASTGDSWVRGRDAFVNSLLQGKSPDASLRDAFDVSEPLDDADLEQADLRFWRQVEGENGPHEQYGTAINTALTGFAKDGESWLQARDTFFDSLRQGANINAALNASLSVLEEEDLTIWSDESTQAYNRFWDTLEPTVTETLTDTPSEEPDPDKTVLWEWPTKTTEIGGGTARIEHSEADDIFNRVEIRGDARMGELTQDLLDYAGLRPRHRLEVEGRTVWFSPAFELGKTRDAVIGYVRTDEGDIVARSYYRSGSQGVWRYLPQYHIVDDRVSWYSKGYGEESVTLPAAFQEGLTRATQDDGETIKLQHSLAERIFVGTARGLTSDQTVYFRTVEEYPRRLDNVPYGYYDLPKPETLVPTHAQSPRFDRVLSSWEQDTETYGRITCERIPSNDGKLTYLFSRDTRGRAWVSSIENDSPIESTGLREVWMSGGALVTPAYEYPSQAGEYGNHNDWKGQYVDMYSFYLSRIPLIQDYVRSVYSRPR